MDQQPPTNRTRRQMQPGVGVTIGIAFGAALGIALNNLALGIALGAGIGCAFEGGIAYRHRRAQ